MPNKKISWEDIERTNESLPSVTIEKENLNTGELETKEYIQVKDRILGFRQLFPLGSITTTINYLKADKVIMTATVSDEEGKVLATGTACEALGASSVNQTSLIENCETSAVGRALALCGIGVSHAITTADNMGREKAPLSSFNSTNEGIDKITPEEEKAAYSSEEVEQTAQVLDFETGKKKTPSMTVDEARSYKIPTGKSKGMTLGEMLATNRGAVEFYASEKFTNSRYPELKEAAKILMAL